MPETLKYILEAEASRFSPAFLQAAKDAENLESSFESLENGVLRYNQAADRFIDTQGRFARNAATLRSLGIRTSAEISRRIRDIDDLIERNRTDDLVTQQLIRSKQQLARQYGLIDGSIGRNNKALRTNTQIYFQAGQAISDFAIAGVRGAANNIEFLAAQLGAGAPLLIGLSLASAAAFTFGDDLAKALNPVAETAKNVRKGLDEVFEILSTEATAQRLGIFEEDLPEALQLTQERLDELEDRLSRLSGGTNQAGGAIILRLFGGGANARALREEIGFVRGFLQELQGETEEVSRREAAIGAAFTNELVRRNNQRAEEIRLRIESLGLAEQIEDTTNNELLVLDKKGKLEAFIVDLQEQQAAGARENLSLLERQEEKLRELRKTLERFGTAEGERLRTIREQTKLLNEQIRGETLREDLEFLRSEEGRRLAMIKGQNLAIENQIKLYEALREAQGSPDRFFSEDLAVTGGIRPQSFLERIGAREDTRTRGEREAADEIASGERLYPPPPTDENESFNESLIRTNDILFDMSDLLAGGVADGLTNLALAVGEGENVLKSLEVTLRAGVGSLLIDLGQAAIAEGTLAIAMRSFALSPGASIAAGLAAVAIGRRLQRSAQARSEQFFGGGGGSSGGGSSRAGSFQRFEENAGTNQRRRFRANEGAVFNASIGGGFVPQGAREADSINSSISRSAPQTLNIKLEAVELSNGVMFRAAQKGALNNNKLGINATLNAGNI